MEFIRTFSDKTNTYTKKIKNNHHLLKGPQPNVVKAKKDPSYSSLLEVFLIK